MGSFSTSSASLPPKPDRMILIMVKLLAYIPLRLYFRLSVEGLERFPSKGPALVVANHTSYLDGILLGFLCPVPMNYFSKEELFHSPLFRWLLRRFGSIAIARGADGGFDIRRGLKVLQQRHVLMIFPEGMRSSTGVMLAGKPGIGFLARRSGAPVVPVYIRGTQKAFGVAHWFPKPYHITVRVGTPVADPGGDYQDVADAAMKALDRLESE
jgi:1-acyl-sn-glycerol-3-phosphate acyltransferase